MRYEQFETEGRRLVVLRGLQHAVRYRAPAQLVRAYCDALGHTVSADKLATDLAWLAEQGLVTLAAEQGVQVATMTERGLDVATGRAQVPGVQRPGPEA